MTEPDPPRPNLSKGTPPQSGLPPSPYGSGFTVGPQAPPTNPYGPAVEYDAYPPPAASMPPPVSPTPYPPAVGYGAPQQPVVNYNVYGANPYPYGYAPQPPGPQTNGYALAAMITGVSSVLLLLSSPMFLFFSVPFSFIGGIAAIILGFIGMGQVKKRGQTGHGFALTGVITGAANLALTLIAVLVIVAIVAAN